MVDTFNYMKNFNFKDFGVLTGLVELGIDPTSLNYNTVSKYANEETRHKPELVESVYKKLASSFANIISRSSDADAVKATYILNKIASSDYVDWNPYFQNVINTCVQASIDSVSTKKYAANALKALTSLTGAAGHTVMYAIPLIGALLAGAGYLAERNVNEDQLETEKEKAKNIAYRSLTADVVKRLKQEGYIDPNNIE